MSDPKSLSILYKRKGYFDQKRDENLKKFQNSELHEQLLVNIKEIINKIVQSQPELLLKNKGQLAALIEGVISKTTNSSTLLTDSEMIKYVEEQNVLELFDEEVKKLTIGSLDLKQSIRETLLILRSD